MRILQLSDAHLESPLSSLPREKAQIRRAELRGTLCRAILEAEKEGCALALLPGDLFDQNFASEATVAALCEAFQKAGGVRFFIAPGNHDPLGPRSPYRFAEWPENVHIFKKPEMEEVALTLGGEEVSVWGCAGLPRPYDREPLRGFAVRDRARLNLGCVHGYVTGARAVPYGPIAPEEIRASGFDYLALGHVHSYLPPRAAGGTVYGYAGCLEGRGFDECGPKGLLLLEVEKGSVRHSFRPFSARQVHRIVVDVTGARTSEAAAERCAAAAAAHRDGTELPEGIPPELLDDKGGVDLTRLRDAHGRWRGFLPGEAERPLPGERVEPRDLVRFELTGELPPEAEIDPATVSALAGDYFHCEVELLARRAVDYGEIAKESTLTGEFVRACLDARERAQTAEERERAELALEYGYAALTGRKVEADGCH